MNSTQLVDLAIKRKKQNWQYVDVTDRDIWLFKTILEQKFLTKIQVVNHLFNGMKSYAEIRIRKLKQFGYLNTLRCFTGEPECYLLTRFSVEALKQHGYAIGTMGFPIKAGLTLPVPQRGIEFAYDEHDQKVIDVRFLFEEIGFCENWHSEKLLKLGKQGDRKVPDGFFEKNTSRIAFELELSEKSKRRYKKIISNYNSDDRYDFILYVCGSATLRYKLKKLT